MISQIRNFRCGILVQGFIQNYSPRALYAHTAQPLSRTQKHPRRVVQDLLIERRMTFVCSNYEKLHQYMSELLSGPLLYHRFEEWWLKKNNNAIQYCVRLGKTLQKTREMLHQAYTDKCVSGHLILRWHTAFAREECQSPELIPHGGWPAMAYTEVNVNTVAVAIREKHHSSTRKLAKLLNISQILVNRILVKNMAMRRVSSVWVLHFFTNMQMNDHVAACQQNLGLITDIPNFLDPVITCDGRGCINSNQNRNKKVRTESGLILHEKRRRP